LSEELGISVHQLSQILNERLGKNFHQYINEHRIEEAKRMILDEPERTVLSVAYAVGFNSKSAFSKAFRTFTGITAQEYRKKYSVRK
ncbi:MAG TPA: helix-turn-helix domain-containing protein, partial [Leptospiraceae bacterium]|nr:helix-turn-helix domain-containing protein [Leptospiraceae bacterium]